MELGALWPHPGPSRPLGVVCQLLQDLAVDLILQG